MSSWSFVNDYARAQGERYARGVEESLQSMLDLGYELDDIVMLVDVSDMRTTIMPKAMLGTRDE